MCNQLPHITETWSYFSKYAIKICKLIEQQNRTDNVYLVLWNVWIDWISDYNIIILTVHVILYSLSVCSMIFYMNNVPT